VISWIAFYSLDSLIEILLFGFGSSLTCFYSTGLISTFSGIFISSTFDSVIVDG